MSNSTSVLLPNEVQLATNTVGTLPTAHMSPGMMNSLLLSIDQLCGNGYITVFYKLELHVCKTYFAGNT